MSLADEVFAIFDDRGAAEYFGERVSVTEHALQAAYFAQIGSAPPALVIAALLHDIGHLVEHVPSDIADWKTDARHEVVGGQWLAKRFGPEVSEPVRLHVPAKRYLLATDDQYITQLSPASLVTLKLQGGPMAAHEIAQFETERYHPDAVRVRRCDDQGKVAGMKTPDFGDYRALIDALGR
jgi:[1-hydroxy-2-(trimethylamino)ethyl]phosphonate dioxygenase